MKTMLAGFAAIALLTNAWAAKDVDFSELEGSYKGKGTISGFGQSAPLTAKVKFNVGKNGSSATVTISGIVNIEGGVPWGTRLNLKRNGKFTTSNLFAVDLIGEAFPGSGKYKVPKTSKLEGRAQSTLPPDDVLAQEVRMVVKPKGKKKRIEVTLEVTANGEPYYTYDLTLTGK